MSDDLKPCPFCGSAGYFDSESQPGFVRAVCWGCGGSTAYVSATHGGSPSGAWNERQKHDLPTSPDLQAEAERVFADAQRAVLVEDAKQVIAKALQAAVDGDTWQRMDTAPDLDRVLVAGWQAPDGSTAGYWWYFEDMILGGKPSRHPDALLWRPWPAMPTGTPEDWKA